MEAARERHDRDRDPDGDGGGRRRGKREMQDRDAHAGRACCRRSRTRAARAGSTAPRRAARPMPPSARREAAARAAHPRPARRRAPVTPMPRRAPPPRRTARGASPPPCAVRMLRRGWRAISDRGVAAAFLLSGPARPGYSGTRGAVSRGQIASRRSTNSSLELVRPPGQST